MTQCESIFCSTSKKSVRFVCPLGHQIVYQNADVRLVSRQNERRSAADFKRGVGSGHKSLSGGLFIARRAIDLAREVETGHKLGFQRMRQLGRWKIVVFNGISRPKNLCILQAWNRTQEGLLHIKRKAGGHSIDIEFFGMSTLRAPRKYCVPVLLANLTTLSSIEGQYRGPVPSIRPLYKGDLPRFAAIMSCVFVVVFVIQQGSCSTWNFSAFVQFSVYKSLSSPLSKGRNPNRGGGSSPIWIWHREKSIERRLIRQGVPVLNLPVANPNFRRWSVSLELPSAIRPPFFDSPPMWSSARRKVPAVITTLSPRIATPMSVSTPLTDSFSIKRQLAVACRTSRPGCLSNWAFRRNWYAFLSHCARGARTLAPLERFSIRN